MKTKTVLFSGDLDLPRSYTRKQVEAELEPFWTEWEQEEAAVEHLAELEIEQEQMK
jgi:hypothetical protein